MVSGVVTGTESAISWLVLWGFGREISVLWLVLWFYWYRVLSLVVGPVMAFTEFGI